MVHIHSFWYHSSISSRVFLGHLLMIEVAVTAEIEEEAWDRASDMPFLSGSITNGTSNVVGCLGEILVQRHLHAKFSNTFNYDLIDGERRIDVKTKRCDSEPLPFYDCSVAAHGSDQECDDYVFVRVLKNMSRAWLLGRVSKKQFFEYATRYRRGDVDPSNGYIFRADCYNIPINELDTL